MGICAASVARAIVSRLILRFHHPHRPSCPATRSARSSASHRSAKSHGPAIGCVVDGCPPGLALAEADIQRELDRRKPGTSRHVTQRREPTGRNPLRRVRRQDHGHADRASDPQRGRTQQGLREDRGHVPPGHADYTYWQKYGIRDYRGGGRQSARETAVRVAAGCDREEMAARALRRRDSRLPVAARPRIAIPFRVMGSRRRQSVLRRECWSSSPSSRRSWIGCASRAIPAARGSRRSPAACPVGWGEPVYDKLDADIAYGDDEHQRGQGRRDRRRLRARSRRKAPSTPTR